MSCRSTTEWVGYPRSTSVQRDSLPAIPAGNEENAGTSIDVFTFSDNGLAQSLFWFSGSDSAYIQTCAGAVGRWFAVAALDAHRITSKVFSLPRLPPGVYQLFSEYCCPIGKYKMLNTNKANTHRLKVVCRLPTNSRDIFPRIERHYFHLWTQSKCGPNLK